MTVSPSEPDLEGRIQSAVNALKSLGAREIYIFGSSARGRLRRHSDLDLAVSGIPPRLFYRAMSLASQAAGMPVDLVDLDRPSPLARYIVKNGDIHRVG